MITALLRLKLLSDFDYKVAYDRQKKARALAEELLENRSRELYDANQSLEYAYNKLKDQKQQIIHQEKLASLGQLSAGVAHEINNPTAFVKSNLSSLKGHSSELIAFFFKLDEVLKSFCASQPGGECSVESKNLLTSVNKLKVECEIDYLMEDITDIVAECSEGVFRIEGIVKGLKDFSRPETSDGELVNVSDCVANTIKLVYNQLKHKMQIEQVIDKGLYINGQSGSLSQVFLNLMINASHAVSKNGSLKIDGALKDGFAVLRFKDNGSGIPADVCSKIFEPFYTTKQENEGTGLGLSISASIIKKHGGSITVNSKEREGAEFVISLPAVDREG